MGQLAQATQGQHMKAASPAKSMQELIKNNWSKIEAVMPHHMSSERLYQLCVSTINHEPKLMQCDVATLLSCMMKCSALGLEPSSVDGLGRAYILPFNNRKTRKMEATFILGYKGMIDLARRSGQIKDISARAVYEGDEFEYEFGLNEALSHRPANRQRAQGEKPTHVYMIAHFNDGGHYMDVMTNQEIEAIRLRSRAKDSGPWVSDYEAMAKKTVIRRAFPYLPVSVEAQSAVAADETNGGFSNQINFNPVITEEPLTVEASVEAEEVPVRDTEPKGLITAACQTCGYVNDKIAADALIEDVNAAAMCCEKPNYAFVEEGVNQ